MSGGDINKECMMLQDFFKTRIQIQKDKPRKPKNKTKKIQSQKETQMTDETQKLFSALWKAEEYKLGKGAFVVRNNGGYLVAENMSEQDANRLARLPELYDALVDEAREKCNECLNTYLRMGRIPFTGKYNLIEAGCPFKDEECHTASHLDLIKKVRDGE